MSLPQPQTARRQKIWSWLVASRRATWTAIALGTAALAATFLWGSETLPNGNGRLDLWAVFALIAGALLLVVAILAATERDNRRKYAQGDRKEHITRLTKALEEGLTAVEAIKAEIEDGNRELEEIELRTETSQVLAQFSDEQVAAIRNELRGEFSQFGRSTLRRDLAIAALGAALGAALSVGLTRLMG